jgi:hypothetical protein
LMSQIPRLIRICSGRTFWLRCNPFLSFKPGVKNAFSFNAAFMLATFEEHSNCAVTTLIQFSSFRSIVFKCLVCWCDSDRMLCVEWSPRWNGGNWALWWLDLLPWESGCLGCRDQVLFRMLCFDFYVNLR